MSSHSNVSYWTLFSTCSVSLLMSRKSSGCLLNFCIRYSKEVQKVEEQYYIMRSIHLSFKKGTWNASPIYNLYLRIGGNTTNLPTLSNKPVALYFMLHKRVLAFGPVDEILKCYHSNESY